MNVPFFKVPLSGHELSCVSESLEGIRLSGEGVYCERVRAWFEHHFSAPLAVLTPSCTSALEMAALLLDIQPGDEIIMPSYTFPSTANAFVLRGATPVFVDIRKEVH